MTSKYDPALPTGMQSHPNYTLLLRSVVQYKYTCNQECISIENIHVSYFFGFVYIRQEDSQHNRQYLTKQAQSKVPLFLGDCTTSLQIMSRVVYLAISHHTSRYWATDPRQVAALLLVYHDLSPCGLYHSYNKILLSMVK